MLKVYHLALVSVILRPVSFLLYYSKIAFLRFNLLYWNKQTKKWHPCKITTFFPTFMTITWKPTLLITYYFIFGPVLKILLIVLMPVFVCFAVLQTSSLNVVLRVLVEYSQIDIWCRTGRKKSIYYKGYMMAYNIYMLEILLSVYLTIFNYCFF